MRLPTICILGFFAVGCATAGGLSRDTPGSVKLAYDAPANVVFVAALEAVAGGEFEIASQDEAKGEIRISRGTYMHGLLVCYGNRLAIFLTAAGDTHTRVEIVERYFSRTQIAGCRSQTPAYVERLNRKLTTVRASAPRTSGTNVQDWTLPQNVTEVKFKQDRYECMKETTNSRFSSPDTFYAACMEARGYRRR
jgi:hypothetical protein